MTTQEYRVVTVSGEVHRVTVRAVDVDGVERWTVVGAPRRSRSADAWLSPTAAVMCSALDRGLLVREIVPPGEATRDEVVMSERSRCAALARSVADAIDTDAARETTSAIVDEILRDRSLSVETPPQAFGRGRLAGLAEAARVVRAEAERLREPRDDTQMEAIGRDIGVAGVAALRKAAWLIEAATGLVSATKGRTR